MTSDVIGIELEERTTLGKAVKHLRKVGIVPAVIYNHGQASIIVQGDNHALLNIYRQAGKHHPVEVKAAGKAYTTLIKDIEFEPRKHQLSHVVFNAVAADQVVEAEVPIEPRYDEGNDSSPAERAGLMVLNNLESITVEALPKDLPDVLYYDAEKLVDIGDHALVSDLVIPSGVSIKDEPSQAIASVFEPSAVAAANDAAGGTAEEKSTSEEETPAEETAETPTEEQPAATETEEQSPQS